RSGNDFVCRILGGGQNFFPFGSNFTRLHQFVGHIQPNVLNNPANVLHIDKQIGSKRNAFPLFQNIFDFIQQAFYCHSLSPLLILLIISSRISSGTKLLISPPNSQTCFTTLELKNMFSAVVVTKIVSSSLLSFLLVSACKKLNRDRKSKRLNSSHVSISYAGFGLKIKKDSNARTRKTANIA